MEFDFYGHVYEVLKERNEFAYPEVYSYLGRRFCLKRSEARELLKLMEKKGYLKRCRRGIKLVGLY